MEKQKGLSEKWTSERLKKLSEVDVRTVDKSELVDIKDVVIRTDLPDRERILDYLEQIKNPYCYLDNGIVVKVRFTGERRIEDCIKACLL